MTEQEFVELVKKFIYGCGILVGLIIVLIAWTRVRNDFRQGGVAQIGYTVIKLLILIGVIVFGVQYAEKTGLLAKIVTMLK